MAPRGRVAGQRARLDASEGLKHTLDVLVREVGVDRRNVDAVEGTRLLCQLVNDGLRLTDVTWPPHLQHRSYQHRATEWGGSREPTEIRFTAN